MFFGRCQAKLECPLQGASPGRVVWRTSSYSCSRTLHATDWSNGAAGPIQFGTSAIAGVARARLHATTNCLWDFSSRFFLEVYSWSVLSKETWPQGSGVFLLCMRQVASGYMVAVYYEVQMTRIQPNKNRIREMASFELGKEIEKYVFSPPKDSKFFRCPTLVTIPKNIFLYFFTAPKT